MKFYFLRARLALETSAKACHTLLARIALNLSKAALADGDRGQAAAEALEAQRMLFPGFSSVDFLQNPAPDQPCLDRILAAESFLQKARCLTDMTGPLSQHAGQFFSESFRLLELESLAFPSARQASARPELAHTSGRRSHRRSLQNRQLRTSTTGIRVG
jgi:hypothetical protein